jgi:peptide/nickel transport system ATP-binding protein/oligopeptide transport system ATP-binding protein
MPDNLSAPEQAFTKSEVLLGVRDVKKYYAVRKGVFGKKFYVRAVDGVSFDVRRGEVFGIVGESGCGKSTLGRMICKLESITGGEINLEGDNIAAISDREMLAIRKKVQMIFQDPYASLNPRMSVNNIVAEPFIVHKLASGNADLEQKVLSLLNDVGLASYHANRYPHEFSGGQRQRIGIARALAVRPKLIIADEPVSALDVSIQSQVLNLLNRVKQEYDLTFVFISHNLTVVEFFSDRIGVMYLGAMVEVASKDALYKNPMHPYTQALMAAIPILDPRARRKRSILEGSIPSAINPPPGCKFHTRCPRCMDRCKTTAPKQTVISDEQFVYCHLYD